MIQLIFTNGSQTVELKYVRNVQWGVVQDDESIISSARRGQRVRSVTINGFLNKSMFADNVAAQQQLETDLLSVAEGTLQYTGAADIENARFVRLDFQEFRGNPICEFTIEFETNEDNVAAHNPIQIGALTLSPANGYDHASVNDRIATQGPDEQLVNNRNREFVIEGSFVGADLDTINEKQADLIAEVENKTTLVVTLSTGSGAFVGSYTVRPGQLEFSSPMLRERNVARTFRFTCRTFEDYGKEPYTLGEVPQTYGNITFDVVKGVDNNRNREKTSAGNVYADLTEELIVRGQRWFRTWTEYTTFRDSFDPINTLNHFVVSATGNRLELSDINVGSF